MEWSRVELEWRWSTVEMERSGDRVGWTWRCTIEVLLLFQNTFFQLSFSPGVLNRENTVL